MSQDCVALLWERLTGSGNGKATEPKLANSRECTPEFLRVVRPELLLDLNPPVGRLSLICDIFLAAEARYVGFRFPNHEHFPKIHFACPHCALDRVRRWRFKLRSCGGESALSCGLSRADVGILSAGKHEFQHSVPCWPAMTLEEEGNLLTLNQFRIDFSSESSV